jgi:hypothetical protein
MMMQKNDKVELDLDTLDRLALISLRDHRTYLISMLEGSDYLHPDDQQRNARLIGAFTEVIKYYGGE